MPSFIVNLYGTLRLTTGEASYAVEVETVGGAVHVGIERFGAAFGDEVLDASGMLKPGVILLIDGQNVVFMEGLDTPVEANALVSLFPPSSGG
jgi:sulfur-carrier protein